MPVYGQGRPGTADEKSCGQRHRMLRAPVDEKLHIRFFAQHAEEVPVAPAFPKLLPCQLRVAPAQPIVEHACCLPESDGGKPPIAKQSFPACGKDPSSYRTVECAAFCWGRARAGRLRRAGRWWPAAGDARGA